MIDAGHSALRFVADRQPGELESNEMLRFALVRAVEIIGEAASKVTIETRAECPAVPWPEIVFMRNRLIHGYFDIDTTILWKTVTEDIPMLLSRLAPLAPQV
jgi:uncharacterized protein with HEPN domain